MKSERAILEGLEKSGLVLPVRVSDSQDSIVPDSDPRLSRFAGSGLRERETISVKDMDEWIVRIQETWVQRARNAFTLAKLMSAAKELLAEHRPSTCRKTVPSKLRNRVAKLTAFVHEHIDESSLVEREFARRQFLNLAKFIEMADVGESGALSFPSRKLAKFTGQPRNIFQSP